MKYSIYKHTINGKSYIGFTSTTIAERLETHIQDAKHNHTNRYFLSAINKHGTEDIITECLEILKTRPDALAREKYWIKFYDTYNTGYNMTLGGDGGDTFSNNPNKEKIRKKISRLSRGRKHTEETKRKMSAAAKNREPMPQEAIDRAEAKRSIKRKMGNYISPAGLEKLRAVGKQKIFTPEYRKKLSENAKNRPRVTCPYCNKTGQKNVMMRWHFDNCKEKS